MNFPTQFVFPRPGAIMVPAAPNQELRRMRLIGERQAIQTLTDALAAWLALGIDQEIEEIDQPRKTYEPTLEQLSDELIRARAEHERLEERMNKLSAFYQDQGLPQTLIELVEVMVVEPVSQELQRSSLHMEGLLKAIEKHGEAQTFSLTTTEEIKGVSAPCNS